MEKAFIFPPIPPRPVRSVLGEIPYDRLGVTDAHNHVWIDPIPGADSAAPVLADYGAICEELVTYRLSGGKSLLDCQPGGCGRNGNRLVSLSRESGVNIIACTGFHRKRYYPVDYWLFSVNSRIAAEYFLRELEISLVETEPENQLSKAGFIKIALEADWKTTPQAVLEGSAEAAQQSGALIAIHTEKGNLAEKIVIFFENHGISPRQLLLCHIDKRPDISLHTELARYGVLLEYDTFFRPKYEPEKYLWPLIGQMVSLGLSRQIALGTDMADAKMYKTIGGGPGLASLPDVIAKRLIATGIPEDAIREMLGDNIARRLAGLD